MSRRASFVALVAAGLVPMAHVSAQNDSTTSGKHWEGLMQGDVTDAAAKTGNDAAPGSRSGSMNLGARGAKALVYGGRGYDRNRSLGYLADVWEYDQFSNTWSLIDGPINADYPAQVPNDDKPNVVPHPGARHLGASWISGENVYVFGGIGVDQFDNTGVLGDLWQYDRNQKVWTTLGGEEGVSFDRNILEDAQKATKQPIARNRGAAAIDGRGQLYLYGGAADIDNTRFLEDLWCYDPSTGSWTKLQEQGNSLRQGPIRNGVGVVEPDPPPPAEVDEPDHNEEPAEGDQPADQEQQDQPADQEQQDQPTDQEQQESEPEEEQNPALAEARSASRRRRRRQQAGDRPGTRSGSVAFMTTGLTSSGGDAFCLFGGFGPTGNGSVATLGDFWCFDVSGRFWEEITDIGLPEARQDSGVFTHDGNVYVLGGYRNTGAGGGVDVVLEGVAFVQKARQWATLKTDSQEVPLPPSRGENILWTLDNGSLILGFGADSRGRLLRDVWQTSCGDSCVPEVGERVIPDSSADSSGAQNDVPMYIGIAVGGFVLVVVVAGYVAKKRLSDNEDTLPQWDLHARDDTATSLTVRSGSTAELMSRMGSVGTLSTVNMVSSKKGKSILVENPEMMKEVAKYKIREPDGIAKEENLRCDLILASRVAKPFTTHAGRMRNHADLKCKREPEEEILYEVAPVVIRKAVTPNQPEGEELKSIAMVDLLTCSWKTMLELGTNPHIVRVYGRSEEGHVIYEACQFGTLEEYLPSYMVGSPTAQIAVIAFTYQLCFALQDLHQRGMCHGMLVPHNLVLSDPGVLKLADVGVRRKSTKPLVSAGLKNFRRSELPPEDTVTRGTDVWMFAQIVHWMMIEAFDLDTPVDDLNEQARAFKRYYHRMYASCMVEDPDSRPKIDTILQEISAIYRPRTGGSTRLSLSAQEASYRISQFNSNMD
eukprot:Clim_evm31s149 gene=Clim_evmTU31s149